MTIQQESIVINMSLKKTINLSKNNKNEPDVVNLRGYSNMFKKSKSQRKRQLEVKESYYGNNCRYMYDYNNRIL